MVRTRIFVLALCMLLFAAATGASSKDCLTAASFDSALDAEYGYVILWPPNGWPDFVISGDLWLPFPPPPLGYEDAEDEDGTEQDSDVQSFSVQNDVLLLLGEQIHLTSGPEVIIPGDPQQPDSTAIIRWTTDVASTTRVDYGLTTNYESYVENTALVTYHEVMLAGLAHSSTYHYQARSTAPGYDDWVSDDHTFRTPIQFDEVAAWLTLDGLTTVVSWKTDAPTTSQVEYGTGPTYGRLTTEDQTLTTSHQVTLTDLEPDTLYHFRVWGRNPNGYTPAHSCDHAFNPLPQPSSSLQNAGFEGGYDTDPHALYPWVQFGIYIPGSGYHPIEGLVGPYPKGEPDYWPAPPSEPPYPPQFRAYDGGYFVGAASASYFKNGGVFQRVSFPADQYCTLSAHYATYRLGGTSQDTRIRLGIDPNGGIDPEDPGVRWLSTYSHSNDDKWHGAGITAKSGSSGVVTVFLDIMQMWPIQWHVVAVDHADFRQTEVMSIGELKSSLDSLGAILQDKIVTCVLPWFVGLDGNYYYCAYIQEDDRTAGIPVLLDIGGSDFPVAGNRITVSGSLVARYAETSLLAYDWTVDHGTYSLPAPMAMAQASLGGVAVNQGSLYGVGGACNAGLRVRVFGLVTDSSSYGFPGMESVAHVDDGTGMFDSGPEQVTGVRVYCVADPERGVATGQYLAATGVLGIEHIDPDGYPGTGDEYDAYTVYTGSPEDWDIISE